MSKQVTVAIVGLGGRGRTAYAPCAEIYPDDMKIVAIADPIKEKLDEAAEHFKIPVAMCFETAEELLAKEKLADVLIIATQDRQHVAQAKIALERGYHILLEKPISPDLVECHELVQHADKYNRIVVVCHVMRYAPFMTELKRVVDSGVIGDINTIMGIENVGYYHQAHSFVRGNWANSDETSPMILQKCCHDMDFYLWLTGKECESVSSFGNTFLFKEEKAPNGSATRCLECGSAKLLCPYDAEKIYIESPDYGVKQNPNTWPVNILTMNQTVEGVYEALQHGPYGRCVYHCDNNVVDHQVVNMHMTDGSLISFTMAGCTAKTSRQMKIMGNIGEIIADMETNDIKVYRFGEEVEVIKLPELDDAFAGHGGGDVVLVKDFLELVQGSRQIADHITTIHDSMESHYCALAAEESRINKGKVVYLKDMR